MKRTARRIALALSVTVALPSLVVCVPNEASAQAKKKTIRESLPLEARGHWDAGVVLADNKNWDGARASFKAAYDASKNPRVLFNLAVAEKELGNYPAALEILKKELSEGAAQLSADEVNEVKAAIGGLEKFVAQITIDVSEKDAEVFVDDEKVDPSKLPGPVTVRVGRRRVRAVKPGFAEAVATSEAAPGSKGTVTLKLTPLQKTTRVNVSVVGPSSAIVKIDGKEVGPAPYAGLVNVTAEPHQFSAEAPGYVTATQSTLVHEGEALNLTLQLSQEQEKGKLLVLAKPEGAIIEIDGRPVGSTRWEGPVDATTHQVAVKKQGFYTWTYDVDVPKGGERSVSANLNEDRNTSFVPWLIGTIVVGTAVVVGIVLLATPPDQKPADGTLSPFKLGTSSYQPGGAGFRF